MVGTHLERVVDMMKSVGAERPFPSAGRDARLQTFGIPINNYMGICEITDASSRVIASEQFEGQTMLWGTLVARNARPAVAPFILKLETANNLSDQGAEILDRFIDDGSVRRPMETKLQRVRSRPYSAVANKLICKYLTVSAIHEFDTAGALIAAARTGSRGYRKLVSRMEQDLEDVKVAYDASLLLPPQEKLDKTIVT
ncbi:MAG: hypothetical protein ACI9T8_000537 [Candidatus Saccharimonadales bacterium]